MVVLAGLLVVDDDVDVVLVVFCLALVRLAAGLLGDAVLGLVPDCCRDSWLMLFIGEYCFTIINNPSERTAKVVWPNQITLLAVNACCMDVVKTAAADAVGYIW